MTAMTATMSSDVLMSDGHTQPIPLCIVEILDEGQQDKWLSAVRSLKNRIIGSNRRKQQALDSGAVLRLLSFVRLDKEVSGGAESYSVMLQREAVLVLGSLAKGSAANVNALINAQLLNALAHGLCSTDLGVLEACVKCLLSVVLLDSTPPALVLQTDHLLERLIAAQCLSATCQTSVTQILYHVCQTSAQQEQLTENGAVTVALAQIMANGDNEHTHALRLLAALTRDNTTNCNALMKDQAVLRSCLQRSRPAATQFAAAQCLTNMYRCGLFTEDDPLISDQVMPCVVRMCKQTEHAAERVRALHCLAYLCEHSVSLQRLTADNQQCLRMLALCLHSASNAHDDSRHYANLVSLVAAAAASSTGQSVPSDMPSTAVTGQHSPILAAGHRDSEHPERLEIAALSALASLSLNDEDIRRKVGAEVSLFECILKSATEPSANSAYVLAVCRCLHALSRSVEQLRITFQDRAIWKTLLHICEQHARVPSGSSTPNMGESDTTCVQLSRVALAVLANLLLPFSPCQTSLFESGAIELLVALTRQDDMSVRVNATWALMNASYRASEATKLRIMHEVGCSQFLQQLNGTPCNSPLVLPLLGLLRNILSQVPAPVLQMDMQTSDRLNEHLDELMERDGTEILRVIMFVLDNNYTVDAKQLALQILENLASAEAAKECIVNHDDLLKKITTYMMQPTLSLQIAAVSCVCNLLCKDDPDIEYRIERLEEFDVRLVLHQLQNTPDAQLYEKVKLALQQFSMS